MSTTHGYFVTVETRDAIVNAEFARVASELDAALQATLGHYPKLLAITKTAELNDPRVEVEIVQSVQVSELRFVSDRV